MTPLYDDYHEEYYTPEEVLSLYEKYLTWCKQNNQTPEIEDVEFVDENNIGHIAYHADLV